MENFCIMKQNKNIEYKKLECYSFKNWSNDQNFKEC